MAEVANSTHLHSDYLHMLVTFSAFMAVLIAIEILINITVSLREDIIHVKSVMAIALMAIARKVIILLDLEQIERAHLWAIASVVFAISSGCWWVVSLACSDIVFGAEKLDRKRDMGRRDDSTPLSPEEAGVKSFTKQE